MNIYSIIYLLMRRRESSFEGSLRRQYINRFYYIPAYAPPRVVVLASPWSAATG